MEKNTPSPIDQQRTVVLKGYVAKGCSNFTRLMEANPEAFFKTVGEKLVPGTINARVSVCVPIREDYRLKGTDIGDSEQDFIFEKCRINGIDAYRIRPLNLKNGSGGWGDDTLEISSAQFVHNAKTGDSVEIHLFRDSIDSV